MNKKLLLFLTLTLLFITNTQTAKSQPQPHQNEQFKDYWYAGKAEITSYKLNQARYGKTHDGYAVLIFVTEDFSKKKQVKLDYSSKYKNDAVKVLKLNLVKKFNTGIYKYSIMESIFTPVNLNDYPNSLKLTSSMHEWCGHIFTQLNLGNNSYGVNQYSYFESDGDKSFTLPKIFLEDELWTRIRINPQSLPTGKIISRLKHKELKEVNAFAKLSEIIDKY